MANLVKLPQQIATIAQTFEVQFTGNFQIANLEATGIGVAVRLEGIAERDEGQAG